MNRGVTTGELREIIASVIAALEAGHSQRAACTMNGVRVADMNNWMRLGDMGDPEFIGMRERIERASVKTLVKLEKAYLEACMGAEVEDPETGEMKRTPPDVKAIQWYLSKRHWKDYDQAAVVAHAGLALQKQANLSSLATQQVQAMFIEMLMASPELKQKAREVLDADRISDGGGVDVDDGST